MTVLQLKRDFYIKKRRGDLSTTFFLRSYFLIAVILNCTLVFSFLFLFCASSPCCPWACLRPLCARLHFTGSSDIDHSGSVFPHPITSWEVTSCEKSKNWQTRGRDVISARLLCWSPDNYIIIREQAGNATKMTRQHFYWGVGGRVRCGWW